jgi:fatty acid desaturase
LSVPHDFRGARRAIVDAIGRETLVALHRANPFLDWLAFGLHWALFGALVWLLGTLPPGPLWIACFVLQGFVIMAFGYVLHEFFVHRKVGGARFSYWAAVVSGTLCYQPGTLYGFTHGYHHVYTGTDPDEAYKQDLDRRWKRFFVLTPVGYVMAFRRMLANPRPPRYPAPEDAFGKPRDGKLRRRMRIERRVMVLFWAALGVAAAFAWRFVLFGYVAPLLVALPLANGVRIVLEHAETNPENAFHCATYYRCGPLTRLLFFWDGGDCHLVHHLFPNIPFYNIPKASRLIHPLLLRSGVRERKSLPALCWGYFVRNEPHRALWSA